MDIKKIFFGCCAVVLACTLQSCLHDNDDKFDEPAAERLAKAAEQEKALLQSASNGWVLHYYYGESYSGSGSTFIIRFRPDGKAEVAGEAAKFVGGDNSSVSVSSYDVIKDQSVVLTFNTYNEILHYFAQPYQDVVEGVQGDYEFVIMESTPDTIRLKGKKWGNHMVMTRLAENTDWKDYLDQASQVEAGFVKNYQFANSHTESAIARLDQKNRHITIQGDAEDYDLPYSVSDKGIVLPYPVTINGNDVQFFNYDLTTTSFVPVNVNAAAFSLQGILGGDYLPQVIGSSVGFSDEPETRSFTINNLDKLTLTTSDDWLSVSAEENTLTISITEENTEGHIRSGKIYAEANGIVDSVSVLQCDFNKDIAGDYTLNYTSYFDNKPAAMDISIKKQSATGEVPVTMMLDGLALNSSMTWDASSLSLSWQSGQCLASANFGSYGTLYFFNVFFDSMVNEWSGYSDAYYATLTFAYDEETKHTVARLGGTLYENEVGTLGFRLHQSDVMSSENSIGFYEIMQKISITKKKN